MHDNGKKFNFGSSAVSKHEREMNDSRFSFKIFRQLERMGYVIYPLSYLTENNTLQYETDITFLTR